MSPGRTALRKTRTRPRGRNLIGMERTEIERAIRTAFAGVQLGKGVSLQQARIIDDRRDDLSLAEFDALTRLEVTDDWTAIPTDELENDCIAHLDAEGLRYYLPALMLWLLDHYNDADLRSNPETEMTVIGTISALAPRKSMTWRWDSLSRDQRTAIASYLEALPRLVDLDDEDTMLVAQSLESNLAQFLPDATRR